MWQCVVLIMCSSNRYKNKILYCWLAVVRYAALHSELLLCVPAGVQPGARCVLLGSFQAELQVSHPLLKLLPQPQE